jgi:hypothetical protein
MEDRKQKGRGVWERYSSQEHISSNLLLSSRLYLLVFPGSPPWVINPSICKFLRGHFISKP